MDPFEPFQVAPVLSCCSLVPVEGNPIREFLSGKPPTCPKCGQPIDVWDSCVKQLQSFGGPFIFSNLPLGAQFLLVPFKLEPEKLVAIDLRDKNLLPANARVIHVTYSTQEKTALYPLEFHSQRVHRHSTTLRVYGATILRWEDSVRDAVRTVAAVTWVPSSPDDVAWSSLTAALEEYVAERNLSAIIPASVAVEFTLGRVLTTLLTLHGVANKRIKELFGKLTFGYQLDPGLGLLAALLKVPSVPDKVLVALRKLKRARDSLAHSRDFLPNSEEVGELICAAVFGFHYVLLLDEALREGAAESPTA